MEQKIPRLAVESRSHPWVREFSRSEHLVKTQFETSIAPVERVRLSNEPIEGLEMNFYEMSRIPLAPVAPPQNCIRMWVI